MERDSSKEYSVVFLVEGEKFKLRNLPSRTFIVVVVSAANSVGTTIIGIFYIHHLNASPYLKKPLSLPIEEGEVCHRFQQTKDCHRLTSVILMILMTIQHDQLMETP